MSFPAQAATSPPPLAGLRRMLTLRRLRLGSGLVLFAYVLGHFLNHALGNTSLAAMESGLDWVAWFWSLTLPGAALYASVLVHAGLGIWALYDRPRFGRRPAELLQLGLGLAIPFLLVNHITSMRLAYTLYGVTHDYAQQLYVYWVADPQRGLQQAIALVVCWAHGCLGLYFWLRLKPWFPRWAPLLLTGAMLVPILALLGFVQGGREVMALAADPDWVTQNVTAPPDSPDVTQAQAAAITLWRDAILVTLLAAIGLALLGRVARRLIERRGGIVRLRYPDGRVVQIPRGLTVLEASRIGGIPHVSVCGGRGRCSTCRIQILDPVSRVPAASPGEQAVLDRMGASEDVRLACQLRPQRDLAVIPLVPSVEPNALFRRLPVTAGEERFVVAMFVDMRGSTRLAESHLPFDVVFQVNRFLEAIARAVREAGGAPNQFLGDGMLALFGLQADPATAGQQALAAVAAIGREVEALNAAQADEMHPPIRFGIGLDAGTAVLGEIGERGRGHSVFTAIGDVVNVASRLQSATKALGVEAVISARVHAVAPLPDAYPAREVRVDGRDATVMAHPVGRAADAIRRETEPA